MNRVDELAKDFEVVDEWSFELEGGDFEKLEDVFWRAMKGGERSVLARLRVAIGKVVGWDEKPFNLPIPGCTEHRVAERLPAGERVDEPSPLPVAGVFLVYRSDHDALYELSNDTVHALIHLAWPGKLRVLIKSRGWFTRLYMAAIWPFRMLFVYPALIRGVERTWRRA